jgi:hypothetical protein
MRHSGESFGWLAIASLLAREPLRAAEDESAEVVAAIVGWRVIHSSGWRASTMPLAYRAVIQLFMNGGASPMDTFDYKPALEKYHGQSLGPREKPEGFTAPAGAVMRQPVQIPTAWTMRSVGQRSFPAPSQMGR